MRVIEKRLIDYLATCYNGTNGPLLAINNGKYVQTEALTGFGIYVCDSCGYLQPLEVTACKECGEVKCIRPIAQKTVAPPKTQTYEQKMRDMANQALHTSQKPLELLAYIHRTLHIMSPQKIALSLNINRTTIVRWNAQYNQYQRNQK